MYCIQATCHVNLINLIHNAIHIFYKEKKIYICAGVEVITFQVLRPFVRVCVKGNRTELVSSFSLVKIVKFLWL